MIWKRSGADCIFSAAILICIVTGLFRCLYDVTGFDDAEIIFQELITILVPFAVLCSFLYYSRKSVFIGIPLMILFLSFCLGIYREPLFIWLKYTAAHAVSVVNDYYGIHLKTPVSIENLPVKDFQKGNMIVCLFATFLLSIDVAGFQKAVRIGVLSSCILFFGVCIGKMPSGFDLLLLFVGFLGLAAMGKRTSDFHKKWKCGKKTVIKITCEEQEEEKETIFHGGQMASAITLLCFLPVLGLCSLFGKQVSSSLLELHTPLQNQINALEYQVLHYDYSRFFQAASKYIYLGTAERNQDQGRLSNDMVNHTGTEILQITVEKKPMEAMYLRGFIGKDYQGDCWSEAEESDFSDQVQEWDLDKEESAGLEIQNFAFTQISRQFYSPTGIEINYSSSAGTYAYLPYLAKVGGSLTTSGDGAVFRTAEKKNTLVGTLYTAGFSKYTIKYYQSVVNENDDDFQETILEQQYQQYVKKEYLSVPKNLKKLKKECRKNIHTQNLWTMTETIREYLRGRAEYSLELDPLPSGEDFTEYFLYTQKKGYCVHFATAAVLMYRICKVPSRFVEGYVVWPEDFEENSDGTYTAVVTDERAHAWAEIYYDGFGFVPVDMTPGAVKDQMMADTAARKNENKKNADNNAQKDDGQKNGGEEEETTLSGNDGEITELGNETKNGTENETGNGTVDGADGETEDGIMEEADGETENGTAGEVDGETGSGTVEGTDGETGSGTVDGVDGETANGTSGETGSGTIGGVDGETGNGIIDGTENESGGEKSTENGNLGTDGTQQAFEKDTKLSGRAVILQNLPIIGKTMLSLAAVLILLTAGKLVYHKRRYQKEWKRQSRSFQDKRRQEVIQLSCKFYGSMEISGYEKKWRKKCKGSLTDREYEGMIRKEFSFLNNEYDEFQKLVQKARFASPEAENIISETELVQCREFVRIILDALIKKAGWYKKLLIRTLFLG